MSAEDLTTVVKDWVTTFGVLAAVVGGWLAYRTYRRSFPRCSVEHHLAYRRLDDRLALRVSVKLTNVGLVLLTLRSGEIRLLDMSASAVAQEFPPDPPTRVEHAWPELGSYRLTFRPASDSPKDPPAKIGDDARTRDGLKIGTRMIEPGERDELEFDFVFRPDKTVDAVTVYTYFENKKVSTSLVGKILGKSKPFGWNTTTLHTLEGDAEAWTGPLVVPPMRSRKDGSLD